jgi:hypothetical protein
MAVDGRVVAFAALLVCGTALFSGTIPVARLLRADLQWILKQSQRGAVLGREGRWTRGFVNLQLVLSCGALVAAGLTGQSLARTNNFGGELRSEEVLVASFDPREETGLGPLEWASRLAALEEGLVGVSGTVGAALAVGVPGYLEPYGPFRILGQEVQRAIDQRRSLWNAVSPDYFSLFDLEVRSGRGLQPGDLRGNAPVALVSESFVALHLSGEEPLGREVVVSGVDTTTAFSIVGVVEDLDLGGGPNAVTQRIYLPLAQVSPRPLLAVLRSETVASALVPGLRQVLAAVDPTIPVWSVRSLADAHAFLIRVPRVMAFIAVAGGLAGLVVASVGLYALLSFRVRQRRLEMGVRMALGADGKAIMLQVLSGAFRQILPATGIGIAIAWFLSPILGVVLLASDPRAPFPYLVVALAFITVGLGAALIPALRAARLEPVEVIKGE